MINLFQSTFKFCLYVFVHIFKLLSHVWKILPITVEWVLLFVFLSVISSRDFKTQMRGQAVSVYDFVLWTNDFAKWKR